VDRRTSTVKPGYIAHAKTCRDAGAAKEIDMQPLDDDELRDCCANGAPLTLQASKAGCTMRPIRLGFKRYLRWLATGSIRVPCRSASLSPCFCWAGCSAVRLRAAEASALRGSLTLRLHFRGG